MLNDLISAGIIQLDEEGFLSENKIEGVIYEKALVRFIILTNDFTSQNAWEDRQLMDSYTKYYLSVRTGIQSICQITGEKQLSQLTTQRELCHLIMEQRSYLPMIL